jgi:hypothetical protein
MKLGKLWCTNVQLCEGLIDLALDTQNSPPQIIATAEGTGTDAVLFIIMVEH